MPLPEKLSHKDASLDRLSKQERLMLQDFLRLSTRESNGAKSMERHLMMSLSFASRSGHRAS